MMYDDEKRREGRLRGRARTAGFRLKKDRARNYSSDHQGGYMIVNDWVNTIVAGEKFNMSLDDVEEFLAD